MIIAGKPTVCREIPARKEQEDLQDLRGANDMESGPSLPPLCIEWREKETRPGLARTYMGNGGDAGNEVLLLDSMVLEARKRASAWVVHVFSTTMLRFRLYSFIFDNG